jgi:hypothetical protein
LKLRNVCMKHYIHPGHATSLTHYFYVYKDWDGSNKAMINLAVRCGLMVFGVPNSNAVAISGLPHWKLQMLHWRSYVLLL